MAKKPVSQWQSWEDAPFQLKSGEVMEVFGLDKRALANVVGEGLLKRSRLTRSSQYRYPKAEVMRFAREQNLDPFRPATAVSRQT